MTRESLADNVADHLVNVDQREPVGTFGSQDPGGQARAWCACGWDSGCLWSRRRAAEAGSDHMRATREAPRTKLLA